MCILHYYMYLDIPYINAFILIDPFEMENQCNPVVELQDLVCNGGVYCHF